jgi:tetratricopeptide (TPR) repeat protein
LRWSVGCVAFHLRGWPIACGVTAGGAGSGQERNNCRKATGLPAGHPLLSGCTHNCAGRAGGIFQPWSCRIKNSGQGTAAICWFGAYLAANPNALNAAAVKDQIDALEVKGQSNLSRVIKSVQDNASQTANNKEYNLPDQIQDAQKKSSEQCNIAEAQTRTGDVTGAKTTLASALKTADHIQNVGSKILAQQNIAKAQAKAGDIKDAKETFASALRAVDLIDAAYYKNSTLVDISNDQVYSGDYEGAQKTANQISDAKRKSTQLRQIARYAYLQNNPELIITRTTVADVLPVITVSSWLEKLDDTDLNHDCPLNTDPFLDLVGYLTAQHSDDPQKLYTALYHTAEKMVNAQNVIHQMLKQQPKR